MSLLMDALKRAEQAKRRQGEENAAPVAEEMQLEPVVPAEQEAKPTPSRLPDLKNHLDTVEADLQATAAEPQTLPGGGRRNSKGSDPRAMAKNVLAASATSTDTNSGSKARIAAIIGVGALAAAGVGGYYYWQLQTISNNGNRLSGPGLVAVSGRPSQPPAPPTAAIAMAPAPGTASEPAPVPPPVGTASKPATPAEPSADRPPAVKSSAVAAGKTASSATPRPVRARPAAKPASAPVAGPASARQPGDGPLRITSQSQESPVMRGYDALQGGRFAEAKAAYTQALRTDPRDADALLGLASLARRDGDNGLAGDYYERVLRSDPRNATAHAGLIALQGGGDPVQAESRLKSLINSQNSDANATSSLNFALGNLYSGQRRWPEAQQAYFRAHTADNGNPDTLYNLAISLEHLGQKPLARQFYEQAIQASRQRSAAFDRVQAEQRLTALSR